LKPDEAILSVQGVTKRFKGLVAVNQVSLEVARGSITALIGPNGAGKTTLFNVLSGFFRADGGTVTFDGQELGTMPPHQRSRLGLVRTFQIPRVFSRLTVMENMLVANLHQPGEAFFGCFYRYRASLKAERAARER